MSASTKVIQAAAGAGGGAGGSYIASVHLGTTGSSYFTLLDHTTPGSLSFAASYQLAGPGRGVSFSPDDKYIACCHSNAPYFTLLNHSSGSVSLAATYTIADTAFSVSWEPNGDYIAVGNNTSPGLTILNHTTPGSLSLASTYNIQQAGTDVDFSADGSYLVIRAAGGTEAGQVQMFSHSSGTLNKIGAAFPGGAGGGIAFSPDGNYVASGNKTGSQSCTLYDHSTPGTLTLVQTLALGQDILKLEFSPDGNYLIGPYTTTYLWDHSTPGTLTTADTYSAVDVMNSARFSPDGSYIVLGYEVSAIKLFDHTTPGSLVVAATYADHPNMYSVKDVDFSHN